ncbi:hypothetical protein H7J86_24950 [Mycobacterium hackensackense]|uniref:hypothetical protein n=1 Tax=Mycobacterium hackensackense TaxID=228909 RepID=UPI002265C2AE|nr:hypothetical protein [Mycobacterium hackensackense]MCV7255415.1 hypothetical protein [Mycobacterium hackensackense]
MGLFSRTGGVRVEITPGVVRPRQSVTATVTADKPVDKVTSARLEWGYDNFYRYHWAGRADSAAAAANDTLWMAGEVGTNYGGERDTDDWVCVSRTEIPLAADEFTGTTASFKVPSWAPGSSPQVARWGCRLVIDRGGRDVDAKGEFTVVIGVGDVDAVDEPQERYMGDAASQLDIVLASPVGLAGAAITGHLVVRPQQDLPTADIAVYWQREREHHPLERYPAQDGTLDGPPLHLGKKVPMPGGTEFGLPFALPLPPDAAPTATSVHSSLSWFVGARIFYSGFTGHQVERVRKPFTVVNAP